MVAQEGAATDLGRVAQQVREARARKHWTRARLAEEVEATAEEIARVEMSGQGISDDLLLRVAAVLDLDVASPAGRRRAATRPSRTAPPRQKPDAPAATTDVAAIVEALPAKAAAALPAKAAAALPAKAAAAAAEEARPAAPAPSPRAKKAPAAPQVHRPIAGHDEGDAAAGAASDSRAAQVIALLERVAQGRFVYQDCRAWLLHDADAIRAETPLLAAYALLTDALLSGQHRLGDAERAELQRLHRQLSTVHAEPGAARRQKQ